MKMNKYKKINTKAKNNQRQSKKKKNNLNQQ